MAEVTEAYNNISFFTVRFNVHREGIYDYTGTYSAAIAACHWPKAKALQWSLRFKTTHSASKIVFN